MTLRHIATKTYEKSIGREDLHEYACVCVEEAYAQFGRLAGHIFLLGWGNEISSMACMPSSYQEVDAAAKELQGILDAAAVKFTAHAHLMTCEVMVANGGDEITATDVRVMIYSADAKGPCLSSYLVTQRHGNGLDFLGPRVDHDPTDRHHGVDLGIQFPK